MRTRYGIDVWARYGAALEPFERAGHLVHEPGRRIRLTRQGMLVANEAMSVFIAGEFR
jgi:coproporphyrinogen III oxidase-like Fe-S oxidoreductase